MLEGNLVTITETINAFEEMVLKQEAVPSTHYDKDYFHSQWRAENNNYNIETRREIEGKNPALIKDVFEPARVLDFGCGPGALIFFLWELGLDVTGLDYSEYAKQSAPEQIRDKITVCDADGNIPLNREYDLVICREVFEHLTALQVQKAVENICSLSTKYIYVTTRYAEEDTNLFALETQFDVDPSHITLLNKEFLRLLFVMQGCKTRYDLEGKMDWRGVGRVLVFERVGSEELSRLT